MAHAQKPDSVFQRNGRVHLYRRGCQFSRVLAFLECGSGENDCSNTGWTVPSQAEDCWLLTPFASFPFTSPPVRRRVPPDSVSTLLQNHQHALKIGTELFTETAENLHIVTRLSIRKNFNEFCHHKSFKTYITTT